VVGDVQAGGYCVGVKKQDRFTIVYPLYLDDGTTRYHDDDASHADSPGFHLWNISDARAKLPLLVCKRVQCLYDQHRVEHLGTERCFGRRYMGHEDNLSQNRSDLRAVFAIHPSTSSWNARNALQSSIRDTLCDRNRAKRPPFHEGESLDSLDRSGVQALQLDRLRRRRDDSNSGLMD
jgi:hypothetical protein